MHAVLPERLATAVPHSTLHCGCCYFSTGAKNAFSKLSAFGKAPIAIILQLAWKITHLEVLS
jgi:hypothetical protein